MSKDINIHVKADGTEQASRKVGSVAKAVKDTGDESQRSGRKIADTASKVDALGGKSKKTGGVIKGLASSMATLAVEAFGVAAALAAAHKIIGKWLDRIKEVKQAQEELVASSRGLDESSKRLASQANVMGQPGGLEASRETILRLQQSTRLSMGEAGELAVSAHSAMGTSGQMLTPEQEAIAGVVGDFAQRKGVGSQGVNQLFKLLSSMGVTSQQDARLRVQQLSTVQQASHAKDFEEFIGAAIKSMTPQLAMGGTAEGAMAVFASSLDVTPSADLAAEQNKQMAALTQNPKILQAMGKYYGTDEASLRNLSYDDRQQAFASWVAAHASTGEGQSYLLKSGISPEQLSVASTQYTQTQLGRYGMFKGLASSATAKDFSRASEGYRSTTQGVIEEYAAEKERLASQATEEERIGKAVLDSGDERFKRIKADDKDRFTWLDRWERPTRGTWVPLWKRSMEIKDDAARQEVQDYLRDVVPHFGDALTPAEVGNAEIMLREAERQQITVNHHYHNETIYQPRTGQDDRGPRAAPGDI